MPDERIAVRSFLSCCLFLGPALALAGPPLSIDDPGILDPGKFEIIVASTVDTRPSENFFLFPILDVSYGVTPNIQVSAVATRAISNPDGGSTRSDFGPGAAGVKWRFLNKESLQMSVAPYYEGLLRDGAADRGVIDVEDTWVLPVEFQYDFDKWSLNAEAGYGFSRDEWAYGFAGTYPLNETVSVMAEIHGGAGRYFDDDAWLYRIGMDVALSEAWHLLASAGSSISEEGDDDLDLQGFLGLQWFP